MSLQMSTSSANKNWSVFMSLSSSTQVYSPTFHTFLVNLMLNAGFSMASADLAEVKVSQCPVSTLHDQPEKKAAFCRGLSTFRSRGFFHPARL